MSKAFFVRASAAALIAASLSAAAAAAAQSICDTRKSIVGTLEGKYSETRRAMGIASGNNMLEVFVSEAGTWSLMITSPNGRSCLVGAGQAWQEQPLGKKLSDLDL